MGQFQQLKDKPELHIMAQVKGGTWMENQKEALSLKFIQPLQETKQGMAIGGKLDSKVS